MGLREAVNALHMQTRSQTTQSGKKGTQVMAKTVPTEPTEPTEAVRQAAREYVALKERRINPVGRFDGAGRWWPTVPCTCDVRLPSRAYPYSLLVHMRTAEHVASVFGVARRDVLRAAKDL